MNITSGLQETKIICQKEEMPRKRIPNYIRVGNKTYVTDLLVIPSNGEYKIKFIKVSSDPFRTENGCLLLSRSSY